MTTIHKARVVLPVGSRVCQCAACEEVFSSVSAFDRHRVGPQDARRCLSPEAMRAAGMTVGASGRWTTGGFPEGRLER